MKVSVAMATYNGGRHLREQLDSIARQTFLPAELVICDDGSTDDTLEVARRFATEAPFPVSIDPHGQRLGYNKNFVRAIQQCSGDIVALCDQDDAWDERKLALSSEQFADDSVMAVAHRIQVVNERLEPTPLILPLGSYRGQYTLFNLDPWFGPNGMHMLFRRAAIAPWLNEEPPVSKWAPGPAPFDEWIFYLATLAGSVVLLEEILGVWRRHLTSTTGDLNTITTANSSGHHLQLALASGASVYAGRAAIADSRADFAAKPISNPAGGTVKGLPGSVEFYRRMAGMFRRRVRLHDPQSTRLIRLQTFVHMLWQRDHRGRDSGGLGAKAALKDAYTVLLGPRPER